MRKQLLLWSFAICFILSCKQEKQAAVSKGDIGDIAYSSTLDDPGFEVCHEELFIQFNYGGIGLRYQGEKPALIRHFKTNYKEAKIPGQNGYLRIRFIINCKGQAGRFRVSEMGLDLKPKQFDAAIRNSLLEATKSADGWIPFMYKGNAYDYYQYLVFKLDQGQLIKILP